MVLDAIEGDLVTKGDFAVFKENMDHRFTEVHHELRETELRLVIKLGMISVTTTTIAVALLSWMIKLH